MKSNDQQLKSIRKGARIDNEYVLGTLTLTALSRRGGDKMLVQDPNTDEAVFVWTANSLYAFIPMADQQPSAWIRFMRADGLEAIEGGLGAFHTRGREFGGPMKQKLGSVQHTIGGKPWQFCDIARGGSDDAPDDNEESVANGPALAMRWIHLVSSTNLRGATHVMLTMKEDGENVFGPNGDVSTNLWIEGRVFDPEDLTIESE